MKNENTRTESLSYFKDKSTGKKEWKLNMSSLQSSSVKQKTTWYGDFGKRLWCRQSRLDSHSHSHESAFTHTSCSTEDQTQGLMRAGTALCHFPNPQPYISLLKGPKVKAHFSWRLKTWLRGECVFSLLNTTTSPRKKAHQPLEAPVLYIPTSQCL